LTWECKVLSWSVTYKTVENALHRTLRCEVEWRGDRSDKQPPTALDQLARRPGVRRLRWRA
jgi:hypothetical protein